MKTSNVSTTNVQGLPALEEAPKTVTQQKSSAPAAEPQGGHWPDIARAVQGLDPSAQGGKSQAAGAHRAHQRPASQPAAYPRAEAFAKFLYDVGSRGPESLRRPEGDFAEIMLRRGSLVDGEDFGILVNKQQIDTPMGKANEFYIFTKLAEMAGPTPTKYYGPFDDSILPNE